MTRDEYGMELAKTASLRSKDPSTKVGCALMDEEGRIVGLGYNGIPRGLSDSEWMEGYRETKLAVTIHAEVNAILNATGKAAGCTAYVYPLPICSHCASVLAQSGVKRVVCGKSFEGDRWHNSASLGRSLLEEAGIEYTTLEID